MMFKLAGLWRGLVALFAVILTISITAGIILENHRDEIDTQFGTISSQIITEKPSCPSCGEETYDVTCPICSTEIPGAENLWAFEQEWDTAKKAYEGLKELSIRQAQESVVLLKNESNALPISQKANITLMGVRSYAPQYGGHAASIPDAKSTEGNQIFEAFKARGFGINPSMLKAYENYFKDLTWARSRPAGNQPHYANMNTYNNIVEFNRNELAQLNPDYQSEFAAYNDAAIVVLGRPSAEDADGFRPGVTGMAASTAEYLSGMTGTETDNVLGISNEEREILELAKEKFNKVIVLINSASQMEIESLKKDPEINAIAWIGLPGSYGFLGIADVLNGTVAPSGRLGDTYAVNSYVVPAMKNYGGDSIDGTAWNITDANYGNVSGLNIHDYLIQAEGIYAGYRYYETRYADCVMNKGNASTAKAGTWTGTDYKPATANGTWGYKNEVSYPFGYGISYATFEQTLDEVNVLGNKKTADITVTVKNTHNSYSGKSVVQLYAQSPYTSYDIENQVEKSAIQLLDYEKTKVLAPGHSETIKMTVDLSNLASYDYKGAKTYIIDPGDYYFAIGDNAHDALNNVLTAREFSTGMTYSGNAAKTRKWTVGGINVDTTFAVSKANVEVTNRLSDGLYAMDFNAFRPNTVKYLTRNDWSGTYPEKYENLKPTEEMRGIMMNDFIAVKTDDDVSDIKFNDTTSELVFSDMKGAEYDDPRWNELLDKMDVQEFLNFAAASFHNIAAMPSVGLLKYFADDGPLGSDSRHLGQGTYMRKPFEDAETYKDFFTRVAPSPMNLAYTWNKELAYENGQKVLGEVSLLIEAPIMIGPGMNIHRHAYNPRGHEYYSEDPVLSGYTGSAVTQGAQSKGCVVNIKHYAFNDQEIQRDGVAVFMNEQKARELELRNFQQAFEGNGQPASFKGTDKAYGLGALGTMLSYNRIGAVAAGANKAAVLDILRGEWGFRGYSVTDYSSVSIKAAPKEAVRFGTTAFCGSSVNNNIKNHPSYTVNTNGAVDSGWTYEAFSNDREMLLAIKQATHYNLYALANSHALNGINASSYVIELMTSWRIMYITLISVSGGIAVICAGLFIVARILTRKEVA